MFPLRRVWLHAISIGTIATGITVLLTLFVRYSQPSTSELLGVAGKVYVDTETQCVWSQRSFGSIVCEQIMSDQRVELDSITSYGEVVQCNMPSYLRHELAPRVLVEGWSVRAPFRCLCIMTITKNFGSRTCVSSQIVSIQVYTLLLSCAFNSLVMYVAICLAYNVRVWYRNKHTQCTVCGYSKINLKNHRCPECGVE